MSRDYRKYTPVVVEPTVVYGRDINIGYATLKQTVHKGLSGWALPGFGFTDNADRAERVARKMHNMIASRGGLPRDWMNKRGGAC